MTAPAVERRRWWITPLLWSLTIFVGLYIACRVNETAREVVLQGTGYLFAFLTTPFIMETCLFIGGLGLVMIINGLRMERDGDDWVEMEVKEEEKPTSKEAS
jgi:hypothetical protein